MLECFVKNTSKGTELTTTVVAVSKKAKCQQPSEDSQDEDDGPAEPVSKWPKKVTAISQTAIEPRPETHTKG
jgi:hypothetical protein